jgi:hypothetical protein
MKRLIFILMIFTGTNAAAQKIPELAVSRVRLSDSSGSILAELSNEPAEMQKARPDHTYHWYSANAIHTTRGGFSGKLLHGKYTEYYPNKNLKRQGKYQSGMTTGTWREWNAAGEPLNVYTWKDGRLSGPFSQYDGRGKLLEEGSYANNLPNGVFRHHGGGDSVTTLYYQNGRIIQPRPSFLKRFNFLKKKRTDSSAVKTPARP